MTLSPILIALSGLLLTAIGALVGGGIAWGRLGAERKADRDKIDALEEKVDKLTAAVATLTVQIAVLTDRDERPVVGTGKHAALS